MPLKTNDLITTPFADKGDKRQIPEQAQPNGEVSLEQGFTDKYQINPQAGGLYLQRDHFNQIFNEITQSIQNLQIQGGRPFDRAILNGDGYPLGARCLAYVNVITYEIKDTLAGADPYEFTTIPIVSMKDNNKTDPFAAGGIGFNGDWWIDDGLQVGMAKIITIQEVGQIGKPQFGYIDVGAANRPTLNLADYPRVKALFAKSAGQTKIGHLESVGTTQFRARDPRGLSLRIYSNGGNIDAGRVFTDYQMSGAPEIEGQLTQLVAFPNTSVSGAFRQSTRGQPLQAAPAGRDYVNRSAGFHASDSNALYGSSPNEIRMANCNIRLFVKI